MVRRYPIPNFTTWQMVYFCRDYNDCNLWNFCVVQPNLTSVREDEIAESVKHYDQIKITAFVFAHCLQVLQGRFKQDLSVQLYQRLYLSSTQSTFWLLYLVSGLIVEKKFCFH